MLPREGHLKAVKRILSYLKTFTKGRVINDTSWPDHFVYPVEDHSNRVEILAMLNGTPIKGISKRQKTVETSAHGSALVAIRISGNWFLKLVTFFVYWEWY
jgi:hypothetical protein